MNEVCPVRVRQAADPDCRANCPFYLDRERAAGRLRLIKSALLYDRGQATEQDQALIDSKLGALDTMIESEEAVVESAATTCRLPGRYRRILGVLGKEVTRCSSQVSVNYDRAVSKIDYSPVAEALALVANRPVAREFLTEAVASSDIEMPIPGTDAGLSA